MQIEETLESPATHPIPQEAFDWYDEYAHGFIDRRTFLARLSTITTATLTMGLLLSALMPDYVAAEQVSFNDPDIKASYVTFPSPQGHEEGRGTWQCPPVYRVKLPSFWWFTKIGGSIPTSRTWRDDWQSGLCRPWRRMRSTRSVVILATTMKDAACNVPWIELKLNRTSLRRRNF